MSRDAALAQIGAVLGSRPREELVANIRSFFASYPAASPDDAAARAELFGEESVFEDPVGSAPIRGKGALAKFFSDTVAGGWQIHMSPKRIVVCADEAVSLTEATWGLPNEEPAQVEIIHFFRFDESGKITSLRVFFDAGTIAPDETN